MKAQDTITAFSKEFLNGISGRDFCDLLNTLNTTPYWVNENFTKCQISILDVNYAIRNLLDNGDIIDLPKAFIALDISHDDVLEMLYDIGDYADEEDIITLVFD